MGLTIVLQNEKGERFQKVHDAANLLHRILPQSENGQWHYMPYIDWYGDTTLNQLQMKPFLVELDRLIEQASEPDERLLLEQIRGLAHQCLAIPGRYLKFYGD